MTVEVEELLAQGKAVQIAPRGYSMYPLLVPGRDQVIIQPVSPMQLRRGDVVLYRRKGARDILVLHRVWKVTNQGFYFVGDNQVEVEGPLTPDQIKGRMEVILRKGKEISVHQKGYRIFTGMWLWFRPFRFWVTKPGAWVKRRLFLGKRSTK